MNHLNSIAIITSEFPPDPGGIGNHAYNLGLHLSINQFKVTVVADQRNYNYEDEFCFDKGQNFEIIRIPLRKLRFLMYIQRIITIFRTVRKNEVIIASGKFSLWFVALATFFFKKKYIAVIHGFEVNFKKAYLKKSIDTSLKRFDKVIAVSNYTKSLVNYLHLKKIEVIPNGFQEFDRNHVISKNLDGYPSLITVGSVTDRKGQKNIIRALPELLKEFPKLCYHIVGKPNQKESVLMLAKSLNVERHIFFHGAVTDQRKHELLKGATIFVMLSEQTETGDVEGFGIALIEANSLGIPSIGSKNCGIEDAIKNYSSGILIDKNSAIEFGKAIEIILNDYESYQRSSKIWASNFTWDLIIKKYIKTILN